MENVKFVDYTTRVLSSRSELYMTGDFSDVTLVSDDYTQFKCHKTVLAEASVTLKQLLQLNTELHPVVFLKGIAQKEMKALLDYIYLGTVTIESESAVHFREAASELHVYRENCEESSRIEDFKKIRKLDFLSSNIKLENNESSNLSSGLNFLNFPEEEGVEQNTEQELTESNPAELEEVLNENAIEEENQDFSENFDPKSQDLSISSEKKK